MRIGELLLGAILGAFIFVPVGYVVRVWLSRATDSFAGFPGVDDLWAAIESMKGQMDGLRTVVGNMPHDIQMQESKLTLMSTEMADFFDKTRKSEERQRGLMRRTEAAMGEEGDTGESDQRMLELMEERAAEQAAPAARVPGSPEEYYAQQAERLGL